MIPFLIIFYFLEQSKTFYILYNKIAKKSKIICLFIWGDIVEQNNRGEKKSPPKKSFKSYKKNTMKSLNEVEYFLNNFNKFAHYIKIYKLFK